MEENPNPQGPHLNSKWVPLLFDPQNGQNINFIQQIVKSIDEEVKARINNLISMREDDGRLRTYIKEITFSQLETLKVSGIFEQICSPGDQLLLAKNFGVLRFLIIDGCHKLKKEIPSILAKCLSVLQELKVKNCDLLEEVVEEEVGESVHGEEILFPSLIRLEIGNCGGLIYLFSHSQVKYFNKLEELEISSCEIMKEIVGKESVADEDQEGRSADKKNNIIFQEKDHGHYIVEFSSLQNLQIVNCPKMETVASDGDAMVQSLFNEKVLLPALVTLEVVGLKYVKEIWCKQFPAKSFSQLQDLTVTSCDCLRNLLTPSIVKALSSLEMIDIKECSTLEEVLVDAKEEEQRLVQVSDDHVQDKVIVFPHLRWLDIGSLPNFWSFYSGSLTLEFPSFDYFNFGDCP